METMALLFAADRVDHLESEILPNLADGVTVISDRYVHSSIAYQSLTAAGDQREALEWVKLVNSRARPPDCVLLLEVSPEEASRRRMERGGREEIYDDKDLQRRLAAFYSELPGRFPEHKIVVIDGEREIEEVHADCLRAALGFLGEGPECENSV
jgi:dTMP kinase